jgi:DNA-binding beta-propeller fold protein YncE
MDLTAGRTSAVDERRELMTSLPSDGAPPRYELDQWFGSGPAWGDGASVLPAGWWLGDVSGVTSSPDGEVYVFQRGAAADPILVYDRQGRFLRSWGRGLIRVAHGLRRDATGDLWATDTDRHQVYRFTRDGELVSSLGRRDEPGAGDDTFNMPTDLAFGPNGLTYIADGYGNSRVVVADAEGRFVGTWGRHGSAEGEFDTPHSIGIAPDGLVYVCDRGNRRLQVFEPDGRFRAAWTPPTGSPQAITITADGECWLLCAIDSIAGRVIRLDLATLQIAESFEGPGHMVERTAWGDILAASLTGNIIRWSPVR